MNKPDATEFDWDEVPESCDWIAADLDYSYKSAKCWYAYTQKPQWEAISKKWTTDGALVPLMSDSIPQFLQDLAPEDTLRQRRAPQPAPMPAQAIADLDLTRIAEAFESSTIALTGIKEAMWAAVNLLIIIKETLDDQSRTNHPKP